jgi:zinc protease
MPFTACSLKGDSRQRRRKAARISPQILLTAVLLVICLGLGVLPALAGREHPNLFDQVVEHKLDNGLKVLLLKEDRAPIITVQLWYRVGSRNEALGKTGISHLCEHLMFKGTAKYPPKYFSREVQRVGGTDNAFTSRDYTAYFETGPKGQLKRWLEMEADRMKGVNVDEKNFQLEKKVVLEERRMRTEDDPTSFMQEAAVAATFEAHPYQWPVIGWLHDIESISLENYQDYSHRYYQPHNCTLVVVGDIDPPEALKEIKAIFGDLPAGPESPKVTAQEPRQYGERRVEVHREAQFPFLLINYHVPNWQDQDAYPLEVLDRILSQGRSSRLYNSLVYKQKLALDAGADYNMDSINPFLFMLYGQPMPGKTVAQLQEALEAEVKKLQTDLVSDRELQKAKNQTTAAFYMALDSIFYRGMLLGRTETVASWKLLKEFIPKIQLVTAEDVRRVAQKYLTPMNRTVGVLVPLKTGKPKMERYHPSGPIR